MLAVACLLLAAVLVPSSARATAQVELMEASKGQTSAAPPALGYFVPDDPSGIDLSTTEDPLGPHGDHSDSLFTHLASYLSEARINAMRTFNVHAIPLRGELLAGHSFALASGYADAGSDDRGGGDLGGYAEAGVSAEGGSRSTADSSTRVEYHLTIEPGVSGLASGAPIEGLRWEFDAHGVLELAGWTYPHTTQASTGATFSATILRQNGAVCGPGAIVCPRGAVAAKASLGLGASIADATPLRDGDPTGLIQKHVTWSAMRNTGNLKAGEVFKSGAQDGPSVPQFAQNVGFSGSIQFDTSAEPLALEGIDFNATVGETLMVEARLRVTAGIGGASDAEGSAKLDFFHTVTNRIFDPQQRGVAIVFEIDPAPTTTTTTPAPTTTTTTTTPLPPPSSTTTLSRCGPAVTCDDGDPCTVDACDPAAGCSSRPVDGGDLDRQVPPCLGQRVPPVVARKLVQGCSRTREALGVDGTKRAQKGFAKALRALAQGARAADRSKRHLSKECATALHSFFAGTRAYVGQLRRDALHP